MKCRAWLGCLGLEPDPDLFVDHLVEICDGIWHVLRDDGLFFLNLADSYANRNYATVREGNLIGVPWRVGFLVRPLHASHDCAGGRQTSVCSSTIFTPMASKISPPTRSIQGPSVLPV